MTRPPFRVRLLGHPVIVFPTAGLLLFSLYLLTQDMRGWPLCLIFGLTMHKVMEANKQLARYHSWQRAWDSMSGDAPRERRSGRKLLGVLLAIGGIIGTATLLGDSEQAPVAMGVAIVLGGPVLALVALVKLWRWSRRRPRQAAAKAACVTVCVTRPLMAVPDLRTAYLTLPDYALRVMGRAP